MLYVGIVVVTLARLSFDALSRVQNFSLSAAAEVFMGRIGFGLLAIGAMLATASAYSQHEASPGLTAFFADICDQAPAEKILNLKNSPRPDSSVKSAPSRSRCGQLQGSRFGLPRKLNPDQAKLAQRFISEGNPSGRSPTPIDLAGP